MEKKIMVTMMVLLLMMMMMMMNLNVTMKVIVMIILTRKAVEESPHEWTHPRAEPSCLFSLFCHQMGGMGGFLMAYREGGFSHIYMR